MTILARVSLSSAARVRWQAYAWCDMPDPCRFLSVVMLPAFQIKNTRSHQSLLKTVKALGGTDLAFAHFRPPTAQMAACLRRPGFQAEDACCSTGKQSGAPRSGNWMAPNETVGDPEWGRVTRGEYRPDRWNALFGGRGSCKVPPHARCHPAIGFLNMGGTLRGG